MGYAPQVFLLFYTALSFLDLIGTPTRPDGPATENAASYTYYSLRMSDDARHPRVTCDAYERAVQPKGFSNELHVSLEYTGVPP